MTTEKVVKPAATKKEAGKKKWSLENVQTRNVAARLNELSDSGNTIFAVNQSTHIGGTYEVIFWIEA